MSKPLLTDPTGDIWQHQACLNTFDNQWKEDEELRSWTGIRQVDYTFSLHHFERQQGELKLKRKKKPRWTKGVSGSNQY